MAAAARHWYTGWWIAQGQRSSQQSQKVMYAMSSYSSFVMRSRIVQNCMELLCMNRRSFFD
eukprot:2077571-Pyramimonas_sp.AAC.1